MTLIDTARIAAILGLTREHVTDKVTKRPDFPAPVLNRSRRLRRWDESAVMAWAGVDVDPQASREAMSEAVVR